ncbi:hypothetical protein ROLI_036670 [Roseobacter fucihabitans]|uniref:Uncharacterized protein n=1 Tax=Roseobacter fucihabitans TaxID=1537242 RepID=A0ABZ2BX26_9RHOB|nr:hypothetical protein [Roseobacter litoralis]MBC6966320.1 hypothetical protein [Roseobacter litoralis]
MFRPIRSLILIGVAFVAGVFFEQATHRQACIDRGGDMSEGICLGAEE